MSPAGVTFFLNPLPTPNRYHKFNNYFRRTQFSSPFCNLKEESVVYPKFVKYKKNMPKFIDNVNIRGTNLPTAAFEQQASGMHILFNRLSKWITAVTFGGLILLRHDGLALWAATGSVTNFLLSVILKQILKQERPVSQVSSGPGMPSSHAQSIFFSLVFVILSECGAIFLLLSMTVVELMGSSGVTTILGVLIAAIGSYFAWLRVFLNYHTTKQVVVGTIVGSIFSVLWFWAWEIIIHEAYNSYMWVQVLLFVGVACYYLGFIYYLFLHLIKDESY